MTHLVNESANNKDYSYPDLHAGSGPAGSGRGSSSAVVSVSGTSYFGGGAMSDYEVKELFDRSVAHKPGKWSWLELAGTAALSVGGFLYAPAAVGVGLAGLTVKKGYDIWNSWSASKDSEQLRQELIRREPAPGVNVTQISDMKSEHENSWIAYQSEKIRFLQSGLGRTAGVGAGPVIPAIQSPESSLNPVLHPNIHSPLLKTIQASVKESLPEETDDFLVSDPESAELAGAEPPISDQNYIAQLEKQIDGLQEDLESLREETNRLTGLLESAGQATELHDAKDRERLEASKNMDADIQKLKKQNEALESSVKDYSGQLQAKDRLTNSLKAELADKENQFGILQGEFNRIKAELDALKQGAGQLDRQKQKSEDWEKLCAGIGAPDIDLQNLLDNWKHQADAAKKWYETIDPLRAAGLDMSDEKFLNLVQKVVLAQKGPDRAG